MKVRIVQLLCPQRHCITALAYETETGAEDPAKTELLRSTLRELNLDPWCGICRADNLVYEDRPTRFETMTEAAPHIERLAAQNAALARFFQASKG